MLQDIDLARGVRGHEQAVLGVPRETDGAEALVGAGAEILVVHDVLERVGRVAAGDRFALGEVDCGEGITDGVGAVDCAILVF